MNTAQQSEYSSFVRLAARLCLIGAVVGVVSALVTGFVPPAVADDRYSYPYTPKGFVVAQLVFLLNHVLLLVGILGLSRSGPAGPARLGRWGLRIAVAGMGLLSLCEVRALTLLNVGFPSPPTDFLDIFFGIASMMIGAGLVMAGVSVARAGRWTSWRRFTPLACGAAVFVIVMPALFGSFLAGRLAIGTWMLLFAALAVAMRAETTGAPKAGAENAGLHMARRGRRKHVGTAVATVVAVLATLLVGGVASAGSVTYTGSAKASVGPFFDQVATVDVPGIAEIVAATPDGRTLVYTDAGGGTVGFVDIAALLAGGAATTTGAVTVTGEPTSVAVTPDGTYALATVIDDAPGGNGNRVVVIALASRSVIADLLLPGQPDSIAIASSGQRAAVAIENEESPDIPGSLAILDMASEDPGRWTVRNVGLTGLADVNPADPEPEFVSLLGSSTAAVTLQENNHVVLVNLSTGRVIDDFTAGTTTHRADITRDGDIRLDGAITNSPRTPDGIAWTRDGFLVTANEGEANFTGGRDFTVFNRKGTVVFEPGAGYEVEAVRHGHYPDSRSARKGSEPEGVAVATFGDQELAFVGSERGNFVSVYALGDIEAGGDGAVRFQQLLPTGAAPEGILPIPQVGLLAVANEGAGTITVYRHGAARPAYPTIISGTDPTSVHGDPFGWAALSGLAAGAGDTVYAVPDNAVAPSRVFTLNTGATPAVITESRTLTKAGLALKADLEGIAVRRGTTGPNATEGFWAVSEGGTTTGPDNLLFQVGADGAVSRTVVLPPAVDANQLRWGFEGVTVAGTGAAEQVYVAFQREWSDDPLGLVRIGRFTPATGAWAFFHYRLDTPSANYTALQTGLSELVALDGTTFAVIERDLLSGRVR